MMRVIVVAPIGLVFAVGVASGIEGQSIKAWRGDLATAATQIKQDASAGRDACNHGSSPACIPAIDRFIADARAIGVLADRAPWCQRSGARRLAAASRSVITSFGAIRVMVAFNDYTDMAQIEADATTALGQMAQALADNRDGGCTP